MCQNLFTERILQDVVEIIILFVFFPYHNLKISLSAIGKDPPVLLVFDILGL